MRPDDHERFGISPSFVEQALEIQFQRPVMFSEGEYLCRQCGNELEGCECDGMVG